uniref:Uncharacterized protein n=1 Tax=Rhizophagus irregularis (strain DAOM 181602 / DAOM 197198 / MUCL 43194) TaxID=747089 RepID=U9USK1_RHIID
MDSQPVFIHPETLRKRKIRENETHNQRERRYARDYIRLLVYMVNGHHMGGFDSLDDQNVDHFGQN